MRRFIRGAAIGAVLAAGTIGTSAVAAAPAFADGATPTTLTVTGNHDTLTSGKGVGFTAVVSPTKVGTEKITGTVDFTVTGSDGTVVPCTTVSALTSGGKSRCKIDKGALLAGQSVYTVVANYSGSLSGTFAPSSGTTSLTVTPASTRVKLAFDATPTSGAQTVVTATVIDGPATALISGDVVFAVTSQYHTQGVAVRCAGTATPASANNIQPLVGGVATCTLPAGWMVLPKSSNSNPKPKTAWSVSAVYNGNTSFTTAYVIKKGTAKV